MEGSILPLLALLLLVQRLHSFPPQNIPGEDSKSIKDILTNGIKKAAVKYIKLYENIQNNQTDDTEEILQSFFGTG